MLAVANNAGRIYVLRCGGNGLQAGGGYVLVKRRHSRPVPEGAIVFEKAGRRYARWVAASGQTRVLPLNRKGNRVVEESRRWYVRLKHPATGKLQEWRA